MMKRVLKGAERWLFPWMSSVLRSQRKGGLKGAEVFVALCDHYEPLSPHAAKPLSTGDQRVERWLKEWPAIAERVRDSYGNRPCHSIFYPAEAAEHPERYVPMLQPLVQEGLAEVEIHLHHKNDTAETLTRQLVEFRDFLVSQGHLGRDRQGVHRYGFIHGDWALCNSLPEGRCCGVNEELDVLLRTGCYADFTFPAIPSTAQPARFCNDIYLARQQGDQPRSHDYGRRAVAGSPPKPDELLLIQGPVALNTAWRKWGVLPRIEHADVCGTNPPTEQRASLWIESRITVEGRNDWVFVKLHTHGCIERNMNVLLGGAWEQTLGGMVKRAAAEGWKTRFVSARQMANLAFSALSGEPLSSSEALESVISRPELRKKT